VLSASPANAATSPASGSTPSANTATSHADAATSPTSAITSHADAATERPSAVLAFLPASSDNAAESQLASVPTLSTAIVSATQGNYIAAQMLLDITQGARVSYSAYSPALPPTLSLRGDTIGNWAAVLKRAHEAPQLLEPGLLAAAIPGGAAFVGIAGSSGEDGTAAANRAGRLAAVSLGSAVTVPTRLAPLQKRYALVVADLAAGAAGAGQLRRLAAERAPGELLIVVQHPPAGHEHELLWLSVTGLGGGHTLTSTTTLQRGLVAAIDLAPTILRHLGLAVPAAVRGQPLRSDGVFDGAYLRGLKARLAVVYERRLPALACLLAVWAALLALLWLLPEAGALPARRARRAWSLRVGALALLWTPTVQLLPAALEPSRAVEYALLVAGCFLLGALTDRLLPWPRALIAPALVALLALTADALAGTQLLIRSLLGPDPSFGARFYGIGNELKSGLAVMVFAAVAAALYPRVRRIADGHQRANGATDGQQLANGAAGGPTGTQRARRRAAATMALAGIALAAIEGSARIGAGVGGVILVCAGTAIATVMLLPGQLTRRRALLVLISPVAGLIALAALDLATAHGTGHFNGSILHARSAGDIRDVIVRRYSAAYEELKHGLMPAATALALVVAALGISRRERLLAPVHCDPVWLAALAGGLAAGVVGALSEDSGPVLLVVAVFALACVLAYLWGRPRTAGPGSSSTAEPGSSSARQTARDQPILAHS
jgi:hypothetical protein